MKTEIIGYRDTVAYEHYTKRSQNASSSLTVTAHCDVYSDPMLVRFAVIAGLVFLFAGAMFNAADKSSVPTRPQPTLFEVR